MSKFEKFMRLGILRCSECGSKVESSQGGLVCVECGRNIPVEDGVPLFSMEEIRGKGVITTDEKRQLKNIRERFPFLGKAWKMCGTPSFKSITRGQDRVYHFIDEALKGGDPVIVDVGAGGRRLHPDVVTLDIYNFEGVDLCARADRIPLADGCVDMIISTCAVEHMEQTSEVLAEMERVLKPGGLVFITAPFIYPYHPEPFDLKRWTADGLAREFPACEHEEGGGFYGPHYTMYVVLTAYFSWLLSFGKYPLYLVWSRIFHWVFIPFKILHALQGLCTSNTPLDSIVYYAGRKRKDG